MEDKEFYNYITEMLSLNERFGEERPGNNATSCARKAIDFINTKEEEIKRNCLEKIHNSPNATERETLQALKCYLAEFNKAIDELRTKKKICCDYVGKVDGENQRNICYSIIEDMIRHVEGKLAAFRDAVERIENDIR